MQSIRFQIVTLALGAAAIAASTPALAYATNKHNPVVANPLNTGQQPWGVASASSTANCYQPACRIRGGVQAGKTGAVTVDVTAGQSAKGVERPVLLAQADLADGEIKRMKKGSKKLTIKHGDIPNLQMPPMTMEFEADDESMLTELKRGDKIKFKVIERDGKMVITEIQPAGQ